MTSRARLELDRVSLRLGGAWVLREVSLTFESGEAVALVGSSGAGKTTLLRLASGALFADEGAVRFDDVEFGGLRDQPARLRRLRARVGFVHQDFALVPNLRVVQNVVAGGLARQGFWSTVRALTFPRREDRRRVLALLERLGIGDKLYQRVDTLSGGQQQRVAIARALFQDPSALLADEPVASVDPERARALLGLLRGVAADAGLTLLVSLHDAELARTLFPRVVGLRAGRLAFDLPGTDVDDAQLQRLYAIDEEA